MTGGQHDARLREGDENLYNALKYFEGRISWIEYSLPDSQPEIEDPL